MYIKNLNAYCTLLSVTDLCLGQFFSLGANFFEDPGVKIHCSDPHAH